MRCNKKVSLFVVCKIFLTFCQDSITALEYNLNGDFLATGDRNGRITVLKLDNESKNEVLKLKYCTLQFLIYFLRKTRKVGFRISSFKVMNLNSTFLKVWKWKGKLIRLSFATQWEIIILYCRRMVN
jgi:WD40 repeat protein